MWGTCGHVRAHIHKGSVYLSRGRLAPDIERDGGQVASRVFGGHVPNREREREREMKRVSDVSEGEGEREYCVWGNKHGEYAKMWRSMQHASSYVSYIYI